MTNHACPVAPGLCYLSFVGPVCPGLTAGQHWTLRSTPSDAGIGPSRCEGKTTASISSDDFMGLLSVTAKVGEINSITIIVLLSPWVILFIWGCSCNSREVDFRVLGNGGGDILFYWCQTKVGSRIGIGTSLKSNDWDLFFQCRGTDLASGQETDIDMALWQGQKRKKNWIKNMVMY